MKKTAMLFGPLLLLFAACQSAPPTPQATETASLTPSNTPTPSRTPRPTANLTATLYARATEKRDHILKDIAPDLELAGYSADIGELAYEMTAPIFIDINQGGNWRYWNPLKDSSNPVFRNFVLGVDVTWKSESGLAGCDILFRTEADVRKGEYVEFTSMRLSGFPGWYFAIVKFNQIQGYLTDRYGTSSAITLESGSTNHYVLVADGKTVTAYANGERLGSSTLAEHITEGRIFFEAWQESKATACTFNNVWVWTLPDK